MGTRIETIFRTSDWQPTESAATPTRWMDWVNGSSALGIPHAATAVIGVSLALFLSGLAEQLPDTQQVSVLAALAAGIGLTMTAASAQDEILAQVIFRGAVAVVAGILAYLALPGGWGMLGLSYSLLLGWLLMGWIAEGGNALRTGLAGGLATMAVLVLGHA